MEVFGQTAVSGHCKKRHDQKNRRTNKRKSLKKEQNRRLDFETTNGCQKTTECSDFTTVSSGLFYRIVLTQNNFAASLKT